AGTRGIAKVEYSTDAGRTWTEAPIKPPLSPLTWVIWQATWTPATEGAYELRVRATDKGGALQSASIANSYPTGSSGYHAVRIAVAKA
ncbi:MAG TPA: molybdopterin-binding oxidoreductase, partial [Rhizobiales bacterium]|nr:molybdopterin-binding oxidoreductase [Hyphomicrobiales bacterium]